MKHEWRKHEKAIYQPKNKPEMLTVPKYKYLCLTGEGNPNDSDFSDCIEALYAVSYGIKMSYKGPNPPEGFFDYTVYPLEGIWDLIDPEKSMDHEGNPLPLDKNNLKYEVMIRQPEFVDEAFVERIKEKAFKKSPNTRIKALVLKTIEEGACVQMLHLGSYDYEPESFKAMEEFCKANGIKRLSKIHREIYLTDARKVEPEKYQTILRFQVEKGDVFV